MKILRFGGIALSGMILVSAFAAIAANAYAMYNPYQLYKDPAARVAVVQSMQAARVAAQQRLQSGMVTGKEYASKGWEKTKAFARRHKKKLIAGAVIGGTLVGMNILGKKIISTVYRNNGIDIDKIVKEYPDRSQMLMGIASTIMNQHFNSEAELKEFLKLSEKATYNWQEKGLYGAHVYYPAYLEFARMGSHNPAFKFGPRAKFTPKEYEPRVSHRAPEVPHKTQTVDID